MSIKLVDQLEPMGSFPVAQAEHIEFSDGEDLQTKLNNGSLGGGGAAYVELTESEYEALSDDEKLNGIEYFLYDTGRIFKNGIGYSGDKIDDTTTSTEKVWSSQQVVDNLAVTLVSKYNDYVGYTNLDQFTKPGAYSLGAISQLANAPVFDNFKQSWGTLVVFDAAVYTLQVLFPGGFHNGSTTRKIVCYRINDGNKWSAWARIESTTT